MDQFLEDTEFATQTLFEAITGTQKALDEFLNEEVRFLSSANPKGDRHLDYSDPEVLKMVQQLTAKRMAERGQWSAELEQRRRVVMAQISDREFSIGVLSGSVLQIAKQGISKRWGKPDNCRKAREVAPGKQIKHVIFHGRNQSMHFENPKDVDADAEKFFAELADVGFGQVLKQSKNKVNLAPEVLRNVLRWRNYDAYLSDMAPMLA
jgi:hypothetical protein